jgi:hypothetical protein
MGPEMFAVPSNQSRPQLTLITRRRELGVFGQTDLIGRMESRRSDWITREYVAGPRTEPFAHARNGRH